jgi:addiction module HigA family antidote
MTWKSWIITLDSRFASTNPENGEKVRKKMGKANGLIAPVHPGEILREDFMKPLGLSMNKLALELHVPATRIGEIVHERRRITAETALRLARYFKTNAEFWLNLQNFYDLECEKRAGKVSEIDRQVQPVAGVGLRAPARKLQEGGGLPGGIDL